MTDIYDEYQAAKWIADSIEAQGFGVQAQEVREAIDDGKSGTEIFMKLRFYLQPLLHGTTLDEATLEQLQMLVSRISLALSR